jgi:GPH family glycoside/pentoside/hexuronide:cation symporter
MNPARPSRVTLSAKLAYAAPGLPLGALNFLAVTILPTFYAKNTAVSIAAVGAVMLATRIFDAVFHPLVGIVSDATMSRIGRKPWVMLGAVLTAVAAYFLFTPPADAGADYFAECLILTFAAWTVLEIPHRAWGSELSRVHRERSSIFAFLGQAKMLGSVLFIVAPLLPFFAGGDITSPFFLRWAGYAMALALVATAIIAMVRTPSGDRVTHATPTFKGLLGSLARNRPFWIFAAVFALSGIGSGLYNSALLLYLSNYLHIAKLYPILGMLYFAISLVMIGVWSVIANWIGKPLAWAIGLGVLAVLMPFFWLVEPGPHAFAYLLVFTIFFSMAASVAYMIPAAMIADIVDYDILKTGVNRSGAYFAFLQLIQTFEAAIGGGLGFLLLSLFGYNAKHTNGDFANFGLKLILFIFPAVLFLVSALIVLKFPITARKQEIIRRRIEARVARQRPLVGG